MRKRLLHSVPSIAALLGYGALLGYYGAYAALRSAERDSSLPEAGPPVIASHDSLGIVLAMALQQTGRARTVREVRLPRQDRRRFTDHFIDIAAQRGWFAHSPKPHGINLIMPAGELDQLEELAADPLGWTLANYDPGKPAGGPSNTDFVNVRLRIDTTGGGRVMELVVLTAVLAVIGAAVATLAVSYAAAWTRGLAGGSMPPTLLDRLEGKG